MAAGLHGRGFLDPKECWKRWHVHHGSLNKVQESFLREGKINRNTGNPPTISAIEKSAFSWALHNQEEARKDLEYAWRNEGFILTDSEWTGFVLKAAKLVYYQRPKKLQRFVVQNGLQREIYAETQPT